MKIVWLGLVNMGKLQNKRYAWADVTTNFEPHVGFENRRSAVHEFEFLLFYDLSPEPRDQFYINFRSIILNCFNIFIMNQRAYEKKESERKLHAL